MEIKEILQGKIDILQLVANKYGNKDQFDCDIEELEQQLQQAKSIEDIKREAFDAARQKEEFIPLISMGELRYETFENYLKQKENGSK